MMSTRENIRLIARAPLKAAVDYKLINPVAVKESTSTAAPLANIYLIGWSLPVKQLTSLISKVTT